MRQLYHIYSGCQGKSDKYITLNCRELLAASAPSAKQQHKRQNDSADDQNRLEENIELVLASVAHIVMVLHIVEHTAVLEVVITVVIHVVVMVEITHRY